MLAGYSITMYTEWDFTDANRPITCLQQLTVQRVQFCKHPTWTSDTLPYIKRDPTKIIAKATPTPTPTSTDTLAAKKSFLAWCENYKALQPPATIFGSSLLERLDATGAYKTVIKSTCNSKKVISRSGSIPKLGARSSSCMKIKTLQANQNTKLSSRHLASD